MIFRFIFQPGLPLTAALYTTTNDRFHFIGKSIATGQLATLHGFSNQRPLAIRYRFTQKHSVTRLQSRT